MNNHHKLITYSGFHKKTLKERQSHLILAYSSLFSTQSNTPTNTTDTPTNTDSAETNINFPIIPLNETQANNMIENCIGVLGIPLGICTNFIFNGKLLTIPMATEEPSVIAACSSAAKTISLNGGFEVELADKNIFAEILFEVYDFDKFKSEILKNKVEWIEKANFYCKNMVKRGGGVLNLDVKEIGYCNVLFIEINVCESMGSNCGICVAEGLSKELEFSFLGFEAIGKICSNYNDKRITKAKFKIPLENLNYKNCSGEVLANKIIKLNNWANCDIYRACTHNKGIMNGITALALATGQDTRAIEASCHTFASKSGKYKSLTTYYLKDGNLKGELELPLCVGTKGGSLSSNKVYTYTLGLLDFPSSTQLAGIMVALGLCQNFAALRALATEGIQKGHMKLHARNIAIAAGTPTELVQKVADFMTGLGKISVSIAKDFLEAYRIHSAHVEIKVNESHVVSVLVVEDGTLGVYLNVAFRSFKQATVLIFSPSSELSIEGASKELLDVLFGEKGYTWLKNILTLLESLPPIVPSTSLDILSHESKLKLKTCSILLHLILRQFLSKEHYRTITQQFVKICNKKSSEVYTWIDKESDEFLRIGLSLILALWNSFELRVEEVSDNQLKSFLIKLFREGISKVAESYSTQDLFSCFQYRSLQFQIHIFLLIDATGLSETKNLRNFIELGEYLNYYLMATHDLKRRGYFLKQVGFDLEKFKSFFLGNEKVRQVQRASFQNFPAIVTKAEELINKWYET